MMTCTLLCVVAGMAVSFPVTPLKMFLGGSAASFVNLLHILLPSRETLHRFSPGVRAFKVNCVVGALHQIAAKRALCTHPPTLP